MRSQKKVFTKASDRIRMEIEEAIKDGSLLPGESVDEAELALQYDVSRTPVREALLQLQAQGLLTSLPRGGMIVAKMDLQQLLSLWELLAELEGVAVRLACQRMTPEELDIIVRHHEASRKVVEADDVAGWQESNLRFHELIYRATRNPYLRQEVLRMRTRTGYYRRHAFAALGQIRNSFEQHRRVVEAFQKGDAESASSAMVDHMRPASDANGLTDFIVNLPKEVLAP
ncbi:GntR family transcriptional regulator [Pigmentiphaga litoralis]|uniref:GntR family transcriptional regulator n=1 Tax=Pigmentiphaga litoralis TaxID=516702 RepID=UPI001678F71C|nr:GntR family transcriptional regulator [Pigmentiphaga litoralis]